MIAREVEVAEVGAVTAREQPDIALVGLGLSSEHALDLICGLQRALGRRTLIEQAKGILMERFAIDADRAFDLLREQSQRSGRKLATSPQRWS
jgi:ANTAR domain